LNSLASGECGGVRIDELCAGLFVFGVGIARAGTGAAFDQHFVAELDELIRAGWQQGHAIFLLFDFFRNSNDHKGNSLSSSVVGCLVVEANFSADGWMISVAVAAGE
jgi:hypothetical protein